MLVVTSMALSTLVLAGLFGGLKRTYLMTLSFTSTILDLINPHSPSTSPKVISIYNLRAYIGVTHPRIYMHLLKSW